VRRRSRTRMRRERRRRDWPECSCDYCDAMRSRIVAAAAPWKRSRRVEKGQEVESCSTGAGRRSFVTRNLTPSTHQARSPHRRRGAARQRLGQGLRLHQRTLARVSSHHQTQTASGSAATPTVVSIDGHRSPRSLASAPIMAAYGKACALHKPNAR
jgi:hypothetical protein